MAEQVPAAGESPSGHESDGEFDPSADMLVNDFDDEQTLEEEEENADESENADEIDDLQREGEMPLEELLAMYGYEANPVTRSTTISEGNTSSNVEGTAGSSRNDQESMNNTPEDTTGSSAEGSWMNVGIVGDEEDDSEDDEDYDEEGDIDDSVETSDWRRSIQVGEEFQAVVPEGLCKYDDVPAYENEDKIVWDPNRLPDEEVELYLNAVREAECLQSPVVTGVPSESSSDSSSAALSSKTTSTGFTPDNEQALLLLHQCGHKPDEAVRRRKMMSPKHSNIFERPTQWSDEEAVNFEEGYQQFYKDFHQIQKHFVPTRSVSEIVDYYYKWKKSERHDELVNKYRIEKKKYNFHPTTTDYMDRFAEEMDCSASGLPAASFLAPKPSANHCMIPANFGQHGFKSCSSSTATVASESVSSSTVSSVVNGLLSKESATTGSSTDSTVTSSGKQVSLSGSVSSQSNGSTNSSSSNSSDRNNEGCPSNLSVVTDNTSIVNCK